MSGIEVEAVMLAEKRGVPATLSTTLWLVFRALAEVAQASEIPAGRVQQEGVDLVVSDADLLVVPESIDCLGR